MTTNNETDDFKVLGWGGTPLVVRRISNAKLEGEKEGENARALAQAQTLAVLEGLDSTRKRFLLQFLYYSALIYEERPDISLAGASLSEAYLFGANLRGAYLSQANNLTQGQIDVTTGDQNTELPDGLQHPDSWTVRS